ncbi:hypothetical protein DPEC_G00177930 [Dallia pectoralis]|uniref:Uncharacterized protein n=1 Tax=Dallia pectoralis TaxID=75939 RepID=A0ACC2GEV7_DALPE|nr:hypothetical protein DPEC_G00177930 [Dallia pectoralis]
MLFMDTADEKVKTTYLWACESSPSCLICLGLGIAGYRLGELTEAEDALTEANTLNNGNPDLWGYLSADVVSGDPGSSALPPAGLCPAPTFTKETQLNVDYQLAAQYYQEADECFHYAVSIDQTHLPSRPWAHGSSTRPRPPAVDEWAGSRKDMDRCAPTSPVVTRSDCPPRTCLSTCHGGNLGCVF